MTVLDEYLSRTPASKALAEAAKAVMPGGVSTDTRAFSPYGIYIQKGKGSRKWDVDGNEYLDFFGGHGALMLGHCHPYVTKAIQRAVEQGIQFAASTPEEVEWAKLIARHIPTAQRVRFTGTGTEATLLAMRIARAFTNRSKIIRVKTHYHGWHDAVVSGYANYFNGSAAPGVLAEIAANTILVNPNDEQGLRDVIRSQKGIAAAIILEPLGSHFGLQPTSDGFLRLAHDEAKANGIPVILDEVISGFRVSLSGYQGAVGLSPDLTCLGKVAAGGMPGGIVCGSEEVMAVLTSEWAIEGKRESKVFHQGTFTGNPVTASAAIATIAEIEALDGCRVAAETGARIREELNEVFRRNDTTWRAYGDYSSFHILPDAPDTTTRCIDYPLSVFAKRPLDKLRTLRMALLLEGADISSRGSAFVSAIHSKSDVAELVAAFERAVKRLRKEAVV